jgi:hypothetical protein
MTFDALVEMELARHDWTRIIEADGPATSIPISFRELLLAADPQTVEKVYWKLENHVVLQRALFEAAYYLVPAITAALVDFNRPKWVRISLLDLLYEIVRGDSHIEEKARGFPDLGRQCKELARQGLWILYGIFQEGQLWRQAKDLIEILDDDGSRLKTLIEINRSNGRVDVAPQPKMPSK